MSSPNGTQAIDRAAMLLAQVVHGSEPVSFTELTAACGLAKSTTSRLLMALERHQLVRRDSDGRFWPGELFVRYAWRGTAGAHLVAVAQPFLDQLGEQTSETINLGVATGGADGGRAGRDRAAGLANAGVTARAGGGGAGSDVGASAASISAGDMMVTQIAQVNSRYMIGGTNWVGLAVPLHCSALGKVLLAFGGAAMPSEPFEARTPHTITTRAALSAELGAVRDRGYAVTDEELEPGLVAVAAPVFAGGLTAIAAISVSAPASRLTADLIPVTAARCVAVASALSATLGGPSGLDRSRGTTAA
ncbi:MAG TPA: IclR family transcriptional regulator [Streptosporangiaceae bacterium]|nr:IclR family transcriptional regulator [Streptosporangiaceae bacterium]